ncbi:MAG TPA: sigma-70 family RNA polymerase sigma factor [Solirubrobacteraceae bacterium]
MTLPPFQRFLDDHADAMWRLCAASVGREEADDAFQEACLAALRAYPRLRARSNLRAWALTIAHRKALDVHRARARRPVAVGALGDEHAAPEPDPESDEALWAAVRALPPGQRAALTLRYAGDLQPAEVAAALRITPEAARRRIADGLARLREEYRP